MRVSPNFNLMRFDPTHAPAPKEWKSKQAKRLYEAGVEGEHANPHCTQTIVVARKPGDRWTAKYGTDTARAERHVRSELERVRAECDAVEARLNAYGPAAFIAGREDEQIPLFQGDPGRVEAFLCRVMAGADRIWVNGIEFAPDVSGAFIRVG